PRAAPTSAPQKIVSSPVPFTFRMRKYSAARKLPGKYAITAKAPPAVTLGPIARPSRPSVRFTAFEAPTITKIANGSQSQPKVSSHPLKNGITTEGGKPSGGQT